MNITYFILQYFVAFLMIFDKQISKKKNNPPTKGSIFLEISQLKKVNSQQFSSFCKVEWQKRAIFYIFHKPKANKEQMTVKKGWANVKTPYKMLKTHHREEKLKPSRWFYYPFETPTRPKC